MADLVASVVVRGIDRLSAPIGRMQRSVDSSLNKLSRPISKISRAFGRLGRAAGIGRIGKAVGRLRSGLGRVGEAAKKTGLRLVALGAGTVWLFKSQFLDAASKFEQFRAVLETVEGTSAKADRSLRWASTFAARTPYELGQVTGAFVRLRAYGMDPTTGLLRTLGDTAAAMGKDIMQPVEAIADAVTGEFERLKELGIKAQTKGDRVRFLYTDQAGKEQTKIVRKNSRAQIQAALEAIWNEKYGGAMAKQSKTWKGMMSNLSDQWTRFTTLVMSSGVFDWMKGKLGGLLERLDKMSADGSLERWARELGEAMKEGLTDLWTLGEDVVAVGRDVWRFLQPIVKEIGPARALLTALGAITFGPLIASIASLTPVLYGLGVALATSPIGQFILAMGVILVAAQAADAFLEKKRKRFAKRKLEDEQRSNARSNLAQLNRLERSVAQAEGAEPELTSMEEFLARPNFEIAHRGGGWATFTAEELEGAPGKPAKIEELVPFPLTEKEKNPSEHPWAHLFEEEKPAAGAMPVARSISPEAESRLEALLRAAPAGGAASLGQAGDPVVYDPFEMAKSFPTPGAREMGSGATDPPFRPKPAEFSGAIRLVFEGDAPRVKDIQAEGVGLEVDAGLGMVTP